MSLFGIENNIFLSRDTLTLVFVTSFLIFAPRVCCNKNTFPLQNMRRRKLYNESLEISLLLYVLTVTLSHLLKHF
jgi:hypothetical protein